MFYAVDKQGKKCFFKKKPERFLDKFWVDAERASPLDWMEVTYYGFILEQLPPITWENDPIEIELKIKY